ncbi:aminoglycoside phosphotransferase family protein [Candidatus Amarobacter glycogenicus]|uniref:aminoglycoside phosphotransferase family protein n=1 Tax=Candidatus Amarobacter glycogenicus TaxID=3140699 RepID=UPI003137068E|nr:aminoglycoside phosphotransferase family protein [Dehalococcoidia bacterium]
MDPSQSQAAVEAAKSVASALGLRAEDALLLHNSNRIAVRFLPCDVLARVGPARTHGADFGFELEVSRRLAASGAPCGEPDPRVAPRTYERDGFAITFWTYYEPVSPETSPPDFAQALHRLHAGLRKMTLPTPHFTDRVAEAQSLVGDPVLTPELRAADRELLANALRTLRTAVVQRGSKEQLLHGEPHPGNLLNTRDGPLFIDLQTACRGPVEFDVAHAPDAVVAHYPNLDTELVDQCRLLKLAMVAAWRWDRNDEFPDGRRMGEDLLRQLRAASDRLRL